MMPLAVRGKLKLVVIGVLTEKPRKGSVKGSEAADG